MNRQVLMVASVLAAAQSAGADTYTTSACPGYLDPICRSCAEEITRTVLEKGENVTQVTLGDPSFVGLKAVLSETVEDRRVIFPNASATTERGNVAAHAECSVDASQAHHLTYMRVWFRHTPGASVHPKLTDDEREYFKKVTFGSETPVISTFIGKPLPSMGLE
ncbi:hypothetical protein [Thalassovita aquimarina]|uniref:hypothetical protein n=1 Tax=Thalassovita aquimarina TaxID=2785917 RepID=UPI0035697033